MAEIHDINGNRVFVYIKNWLVPALITMFLLGFVWGKQRGVLLTLFYTAMMSCIILNPSAFFPLIRKQRLLLLFIFWYTLSLLWSPNISIGLILDNFRYALCLIILPVLFSRLQPYGLLLRTLGLFSTPIIIYNAISFYRVNPIYERLVHLGRHPVSSSWYYMFFSLIAYSNIIRFSLRKTLFFKLNVLAFGILSSALILTQSRGAIIGFILGLSVPLLKLPSLRRFSSVVLLFIIIAMLVAPRTSNAVELPMPRKVTEAAEHFITRGATFRTEIWRSALYRMSGHWMSGHGLTACTSWLQSQHRDYGIPYPVAHLHSLFVWALYHGGIIGLSLTLLLLGNGFINAVTLHIHKDESLPLILLAAGATCCVVDGTQFISGPRPEWLIFWIPLAIGLSNDYSSFNNTKTISSARDTNEI